MYIRLVLRDVNVQRGMPMALLDDLTAYRDLWSGFARSRCYSVDLDFLGAEARFLWLILQW